MTTRPKTRRTNPARRGSILILAVIILVLIALMGLAYLQQARMDRFATDEYERDYMPLVINGIIGDVRQIMTDDLEDRTNPGLGGSQYSPSGLYDYPWTSLDQNVTVEDGGNNVISVNGDPEDDRWLASTAPLVRGTGPTDYTWMHLSNIGGIWLDLPLVGSTAQVPLEYPIRAATYNVDITDSDTNLTGTLLESSSNPAMYEIRGVDTDGDGIKDARWTWAPPASRKFGGRAYVYAARIVDLSSLLNINVATPTSNGTNPPTATTGYTPADIDLARFFKRAEDGITAMSGEWQNESRP